MSLFFVDANAQTKSEHSPEWTHSSGRNQWQGWLCSSGLRSLYIDYDGNAFAGTCEAGGWYGNLYRQGWSHLPKDWITCPRAACSCCPDMLSPKVKNRNLIPNKFSDFKTLLTLSKSPQGNEVANPNMILSPRALNQKLVTWEIGRRCNYNCTYCYPNSHNTYEAHKSLASLQHAAKNIQAWSQQEESIHFVILGGEPTLHPQYLEFVRHLRSTHPQSTVSTVTNGSRDETFLTELFLYSSLTFSAHLEALSDADVYRKFVAKAGACAKVRANGVPQEIQIRVMLKPGTLKLARELHRDLESALAGHGKVFVDLLHESNGKTILPGYTEEERVFMTEIQDSNRA